MPGAWAAATRPGDTPVRVAIVDGGTEWGHPDILANVLVNERDIPGDGIDQDGNGFVDDVYGWCFARGYGDPSGLDGQPFNERQGTHVAGLAGAVLGNGIGVAGAGGNPHLILVNAAHPTIDGGIAWGYEGILYALGRGADVINCSWRTARFAKNRILDAGYSQFEALVVRVAREAGALVVGAAGNDFADGLWTTPAGYEEVLAVTATLRDATILWPGSNVAPWIDVAAPGDGMISTFPTDQPAVEGPYGLLSGTSMAAAYTSGVAAFIWREHPEWSVDQLRSRIGWSALDVDLRSDVRLLRADSLLSSGARPDLAIRLRGLVDEDGDGLAEGGEIVDLRFEIGATFASRAGVTVESWTDDPWLVPLIPNMPLSSVPTGTPLDVRRGIKYWVNPAAPAGHVARVSLRAITGGISGPVTGGTVRLRSLTATLDSGDYVAASSANGVLGESTQVVSGDPATPALGRLGDGAGFLTKGALLLAGAGSPAVSDAVMPRVPTSPYKDFAPVGGGITRAADAQGVPELRIEYSDRGAPSKLGMIVRQRISLHDEGEAGAFLLADYEVSASERPVPQVRWGLALDFTVPAWPPTDSRGAVAERLVVFGGATGMRAEAAVPGEGAGVAGVLLLGQFSRPGFAALAQWALDDEEGWNVPGAPGETVSDEVLWQRMQEGIDAATLDGTGDRVAILSGELGDVTPGEPSTFSVAIALAADAAALERVLDRARVTWEAAQVGLTPETLPSGLIGFSRNPFRDDTTVEFALSLPGQARLDVYDLRGRRVRSLLDEPRSIGVHRAVWDGRDGRGRAVASGLYLVRLQTRSGTSTERVTLVR
jgi:hypothetical protein